MENLSSGQAEARDDEDIWSRFLDASDSNLFFDAWLKLQGTFISEAIQGFLVTVDGGGAFRPIAKWAIMKDTPERLFEVMQHAVSEGCGMIAPLDSVKGDLPRYGIAFPVEIDGSVRFVAALEVMLQDKEGLKPIMERLQWGSGWIELYVRRNKALEDNAALLRMQKAIDLLAGALGEEHFKSACMSFVAELANALKCDRVSLGFVKRGHIRIETISHSAQFGKQMNLVRAIAAAMEEAVFQRLPVVYPPSESSGEMITRDHEALSRQEGTLSILTMPLYNGERYYGALLLERPDPPFGEKDIEFCQGVAALIAPALEDKRLNDRHILIKAGTSFLDQSAKFLGPGYLGRKLAALAILIVVLFFAFAMGDYRVTAEAALEGEKRRVIVAPINGYIEEAAVRAGDRVAAGALMVALDDRDLRLERLNWMSKQKQLERQYQEALAEHNRAQAKILAAQLDQASAELELAESNLERSRMFAPFDGIVLTGDLSQRLGGAVQQGEVLFEVAPSDVYRLILKVNDRDIDDLAEGQQGMLVLTALPEESYPFKVARITSIAAAEEGVNYFRVEADLGRVSLRLRPGMEGIGKTYVERRKLIHIWTKNMVDWLRIQLWKWWP